MFAADPPRPERLRTIERPFGWAACRLVTSGMLGRLGVSAKALYLSLCLVADRRGLSYWGERRLQQLVGLEATELCRARQELIDHDVLAFDGRLYQLLSLPCEPARRSRPAPVAPRPRPAPAAPARSGPPVEPKQIAALLAPLKEKLRRGR